MTAEYMLLKTVSLGLVQSLYNQQLLLAANLKNETIQEYRDAYEELIKQTGEVNKMLRESAKITGSIMDT